MYKPANAAVIVGIAITTPYLTKSTNENFTSYLFTKEENIIPASAPIGVKNAPMLLPITLAYIALSCKEIGKEFGKLENKILIGIKLMRLEANKEEYPCVQITCSLFNALAISPDIP